LLLGSTCLKVLISQTWILFRHHCWVTKYILKFHFTLKEWYLRQIKK
jgi:hypothetical protein